MSIKFLSGIDVDSNTLFVDSANDRVGIGTASPAQRLNVKGSAGNGIALTHSNDTVIAELIEFSGVQGAGLVLKNSSGTTNVLFNAGGDSYFNGGNVGIGTTSPGAKLHVDDSSADAVIRLSKGSSTIGNIDFVNEGNRFSIQDDGSRRLVIDTAGNVGIGTTSPDDKLVVAGVIKSIGGTNNGKYAQIFVNDSYAYYTTDASVIYMNKELQISGGFIGSYDGDLSLRTAGTTRIRVENSTGNVGIGTTSPSVALHTNGFIRSANSGNTVYTEIQNDGLYATGTDLYLLAPSTKFISFYAGGAERMRVSSAGALKLNAYGSGSNTGTATQRLAVDASGNVIEIPIGSGAVDGSGTANYVTKWSDSDTITDSQIFDNGTSVGIGGTPATNYILTLRTHSSDYTKVLDWGTDVGGSWGNMTINVSGSPYQTILSSGAWQFNTGGTAKVFIDGTGNVGIGTTNPVSSDLTGALTIVKSHNGDTPTSPASQSYDVNQSNLYLFGRNAGLTMVGASGEESIIAFANPFSAYTAGIRYESGTGVSGGDMKFQTSGTNERMRITAGGNIGIGTTAPASILHISTTGANAYSSTITKGSNMKGIVNTLSNNGDDMVGIYFATGTNAEGTHWSGITGSRSNSSTDWSTQLNFYTHDENTSNITDATQKMVIKGSGNVGIGTTSPTGELHIYGSQPAFRIQSSVSGNMQFGQWDTTTNRIQSTGRNFYLVGTDAYDTIFATNGSEAMRITSAGYIGIGTTAPSVKLQVEEGVIRAIGTTSSSGQIDASPTYGAFRFYDGTTFRGGLGTGTWASVGAGSDIVQYLNSVNYYISNQTTALVKVESGGNVGIGTSAPVVKTHIVGPTLSTTSETTYPLWLSDTGDTTKALILGYDLANDAGVIQAVDQAVTWKNVLISPTGGNVGIGTTSPSYKLSVVGESNFSENIYIGNGSSYGVWTDTAGVRRNGFYLNASSSYLGIRAGNSSTGEQDRIVIQQSTGNVGIGTTAPSTILHVKTSGNTDTGIRSDVGLDNNVASTPTAIFLNNIGGDTSDAVAATFGVGGADRAKIISGRYSTGGYIQLQTANTSNSLIDRVRIDNDGNVGIGTTAPAQKLHVSSASAIFQLTDTNKTANNSIWIQALSQTSWGIGTANDASSGTKITIADSGNVGIGTTSPKSYSSLTTQGQIISLGNIGIDVAQSFRLNNYYNSATVTDRTISTGYAASIGLDNSVGAMTFLTSASSVAADNNTSVTEKMRITSAGNVGIGTTSPSLKLSLGSDTGRKLFIYDDGGGANDIGGGMGVDMGGFSAETSIFFGNWSGSGRLSIGAWTSSQTYSTKLTILANGNVGIGTTSPNYKLEVVGGSVNTQIARFITADYPTHSVGLGVDGQGSYWGASIFQDDVKRFTVDSTGGILVGGNYQGSNAPANGAAIEGNVGIGTTSPTNRLFVTDATSGDYAAFIENTNSTNGYGLVAKTAHTGTSAYAFAARAGSTDVFVVRGDGNVGIGTTSPSQKLHVVGKALITDDVQLTGSNPRIDFNSNGASSLRFYDTTNASERMRIDTSGNVGIGTTSPGYKLDVSGTIRATGDVIAYSDARVKENVETIDGALDKVLDMRGVFYNKIGEHEKKVGVIAQEIIKVLPEVVSQDETGTYSVAYGNITAVLIEAVKELSARVEFLEEKLKQK